MMQRGALRLGLRSSPHGAVCVGRPTRPRRGQTRSAHRPAIETSSSPRLPLPAASAPVRDPTPRCGSAV